MRGRRRLLLGFVLRGAIYPEVDVPICDAFHGRNGVHQEIQRMVDAVEVCEGNLAFFVEQKSWAGAENVDDENDDDRDEAVDPFRFLFRIGIAPFFLFVVLEGFSVHWMRDGIPGGISWQWGKDVAGEPARKQSLLTSSATGGRK